MERLKTARGWFEKEIAYLTARPLLCSVNTASGQDEEEEEEVGNVADKQVRGQIQKLQGLVRKRWLDDATKVKNGLVRPPLSHGEMRDAASKWVVEAANADGDEWASDDVSAWNFQYRATDRIF